MPLKSGDGQRQLKFPISDNSQALVWGTQNLMTDKQVRRLFALGKGKTNLETAAAKAGMDAKTARKYSKTITRLLDTITSSGIGRRVFFGGLRKSV
jgi:hypothetical protein